MSNKMYVGNLPFSVEESDLRDAFAQFGAVTEVNLVMDRETGRPRGFAFVTMETKEGMEAAIKGQDGKDLAGRCLTVNEARPREERPAYGGSDRRGGGGGGKSGYDSKRRSNQRW
jgi:RNA recognition motif-containing protein